MNKTLEEQIVNYCKEYNIPSEYLFEILEDQKVVPMIRGKACEFNAYLFLKEQLEPTHEWYVQKLNLNAQQGLYDEDVTLTHRKTGIRLKVEVKNAVRGSFSTGKRCRILRVPHFKVKCHKSRSNLALADSTNDRYLIDEFDVIISNTLNALYIGGTIDGLQITKDEELLDVLYSHYQVNNIRELENACANDWRFAIPQEISEDNKTIPRTPYVRLSADLKWVTIDKLCDKLSHIINTKWTNRKQYS